MICFNDRLALGAYQALDVAGLAVPNDVSVISFDDDLEATWLRPQPTTVALPHDELGCEAISRLLGTDHDQASDSGRPATAGASCQLLAPGKPKLIVRV